MLIGWKDFSARHNELIEQAIQCQKDLEALKTKAEEFYDGMRWKDSHMSSQEYDSIFGLLRNMEDTDFFDRAESAIKALQALAATGKVETFRNRKVSPAGNIHVGLTSSQQGGALIPEEVATIKCIDVCKII